MRDIHKHIIYDSAARSHPCHWAIASLVIERLSRVSSTDDTQATRPRRTEREKHERGSEHRFAWPFGGTRYRMRYRFSYCRTERCEAGRKFATGFVLTAGR